MAVILRFSLLFPKNISHKVTLVTKVQTNLKNHDKRKDFLIIPPFLLSAILLCDKQVFTFINIKTPDTIILIVAKSIFILQDNNKLPNLHTNKKR